MLKFLRNNQRVFFIIIAFIIIVSFSFFGTQKVIDGFNRPKDIDVGASYSGRKIKLSELQKMSHFLSSDMDDIMFAQNMHIPNLFNDGVVKKEFLSTNLIKLFFENYLDELKPSFENIFEKVQAYKPYRHFDDKNISLENIWKTYNPELLEKLKLIKEEKEVNLNFLNLLVDIYNLQNKFSPALTQRILIYQEKQNPNLEQDPRLYSDASFIFNFKTNFDWFGKDFYNLLSQFIINVSDMANEKGIKTSNDESIYELKNNLKTALDRMKYLKNSNEYQKILSALSLSEKDAVNIWKTILNFRKFFKNNSVVAVDELPFKDFASFANKKALVTSYCIPKEYQIQNFEDLINFEAYLTLTTNKESALDIPLSQLNVFEIEKKWPELIEEEYTLEIKKISLSEAALQIKVKDLLTWQLQNFEMISKKFSFLKNQNDDLLKIKALDKLNFAQRKEIDDFSKNKIISENPNKIKEALSKAQQVNEKIFIKSKNTKAQLSFEKMDDLISLIKEKDFIDIYTEDNENFYSLKIIQKPLEKKIISFEKAKKDNILMDLFAAYLISKDPNSFDSKDIKKSIKASFEIVFKDLLIELKNISKSNDLNEISKYRFFKFMENNLNELLENKRILNSFINITKNNLEIENSEKLSKPKKDLFSMKEKSFSNVFLDNTIEFCFLDKIDVNHKYKEKLSQVNESLSLESKKIALKNVLKIFQQKQLLNVKSINVREEDI